INNDHIARAAADVAKYNINVTWQEAPHRRWAAKAEMPGRSLARLAGDQRQSPQHSAKASTSSTVRTCLLADRSKTSCSATVSLRENMSFESEYQSESRVVPALYVRANESRSSVSGCARVVSVALDESRPSAERSGVCAHAVAIVSEPSQAISALIILGFGPQRRRDMRRPRPRSRATRVRLVSNRATPANASREMRSADRPT